MFITTKLNLAKGPRTRPEFLGMALGNSDSGQIQADPNSYLGRVRVQQIRVGRVKFESIRITRCFSIYFLKSKIQAVSGIDNSD